jgi:hypothetical protein
VKQQIAWVAVGLSIVAFTPVSSQQCDQVRSSALQPLLNVTSYLKMNPDMESLSGPGCLYILQQMRKMPHGADLLRQVATQRVENTSSRCLYGVNSIKYVCNDPKLGEAAACAPQTYTYCGQWEYSMTNYESRYEMSMEHALRLDVAFDKAQALCGMAMRWDFGALKAMRDLKAYVDDELIETSERLVGEVCAK